MLPVADTIPIDAPSAYRPLSSLYDGLEAVPLSDSTNGRVTGLAARAALEGVGALNNDALGA